MNRKREALMDAYVGLLRNAAALLIAWKELLPAERRQELEAFEEIALILNSNWGPIEREQLQCGDEHLLLGPCWICAPGVETARGQWLAALAALVDQGP